MRWPFQRWFEAKAAVLDGMDRRRIYVENVRAFLGVSYRTAHWLCEKACRDGMLEKWVALENPSRGRTLLEHRASEPPPVERVIDDVAESLGEPYEFHVAELKRVEFYRSTQ